MLSKRLFSAAILITLSLTLIWLDLRNQHEGRAGLWTLPMLVFFTLGTVWEFAALLARKWAVNPKVVLGSSSVALLVSLFPIWYSAWTQKAYPVDCPVGRLGWILIGMMTGVGCTALFAMREFGRHAPDAELESNADSLRNEHQMRTTLGWLLSSMVICYVVSGTMVWQVIRMRGGFEGSDFGQGTNSSTGISAQGIYELIALLTIIKSADAGAYFAGKAFGRNKLIPSISPAKTVEGLIGGCLVAIVVSYVAFRWALPQLGVPSGPYIWGPALLGGMLTIVGLVGDLLESMVKRSVGAKDSGNLLPGLGGVWDVTDSALPAAFISYLGLMAHL